MSEVYHRGVGCEVYPLVFEKDICHAGDCFRGSTEEIWQVDPSHRDDGVYVE